MTLLLNFFFNFAKFFKIFVAFVLTTSKAYFGWNCAVFLQSFSTEWVRLCPEQYDCTISSAGKFTIFISVGSADSTSQHLLTSSNCRLGSTVVLELKCAPLSISKSKEPSPSYSWLSIGDCHFSARIASGSRTVNVKRQRWPTWSTIPPF